MHRRPCPQRRLFLCAMVAQCRGYDVVGQIFNLPCDRQVAQSDLRQSTATGSPGMIAGDHLADWKSAPRWQPQQTGVPPAGLRPPYFTGKLETALVGRLGWQTGVQPEVCRLPLRESMGPAGWLPHRCSIRYLESLRRLMTNRQPEFIT